MMLDMIYSVLLLFNCNIYSNVLRSSSAPHCRSSSPKQYRAGDITWYRDDFICHLLSL